MSDTKRTVAVEINYTPSYSGFGGWDSWELPELTGDQIDKLMKDLQTIIEHHGGHYTGQN